MPSNDWPAAGNTKKAAEEISPAAFIRPFQAAVVSRRESRDRETLAALIWKRLHLTKRRWLPDYFKKAASAGDGPPPPQDMDGVERRPPQKRTDP